MEQCSRGRALLGHLELEGQVCPKYSVIYYIIAPLGGGFCGCCWEQVADGSKLSPFLGSCPPCSRSPPSPTRQPTPTDWSVPVFDSLAPILDTPKGSPISTAPTDGAAEAFVVAASHLNLSLCLNCFPTPSLDMGPGRSRLAPCLPASVSVSLPGNLRHLIVPKSGEAGTDDKRLWKSEEGAIARTWC